MIFVFNKAKKMLANNECNKYNYLKTCQQSNGIIYVILQCMYVCMYVYSNQSVKQSPDYHLDLRTLILGPAPRFLTLFGSYCCSSSSE